MSDDIMHAGDTVDFEDSEHVSDLNASETAKPDMMDFHVQMNGYTMRDFESLVVNVAADRLLGKFGNDRLSRLIEEKAIEKITAKIDAKLETVTAEILNQPLTPKAFGKSEPVTMAEFIGLVGKDYLTEIVGRDGKPAKDGWGRRDGRPRIQHLLGDLVNRDYAQLLKEQTGKLIVEVRAEASRQLQEKIDAERKRIADALGLELKSKK